MRSIKIRNAPAIWDKGIIWDKFSQYGPVENVIFEPPNVIVEFESEDDAEEAVRENKESEFEVLFYRGDVQTRVSFEVFTIESQPKVVPQVNSIHCSNSNCTKQVIVENLRPQDPSMRAYQQEINIYCSNECYNSFVDLDGRVDIYNKWIASLGRSGTGLLKDHKKLDKIKITIAPDGYRSVKNSS